MPKTKRKDEDPEFKPGKSRKSVFYDPKVDDRSVQKELQKLKCKLPFT